MHKIGHYCKWHQFPYVFAQKITGEVFGSMSRKEWRDYLGSYCRIVDTIN